MKPGQLIEVLIDGKWQRGFFGGAEGFMATVFMCDDSSNTEEFKKVRCKYPITIIIDKVIEGWANTIQKTWGRNVNQTHGKTEELRAVQPVGSASTELPTKQFDIGESVVWGETGGRLATVLQYLGNERYQIEYLCRGEPIQVSLHSFELSKSKVNVQKYHIGESIVFTDPVTNEHSLVTVLQYDPGVGTGTRLPYMIEVRCSWGIEKVWVAEHTLCKPKKVAKP